MFYRRKILLAIIEQFGELNRTELQKLLFLFTQNQENKSFDFIPYKYGCYSFQADNDLRILSNQKQLVLKEGDGEKTTISIGFESSILNELKRSDRENLFRLRKKFKDYPLKSLVRYTYLNFPYYAINSKVASRILSPSEIKLIENERRLHKGKSLFTIGYEGITLETYINKLIANGVDTLCDVRRNSFSMKYGFSKNQLMNACNSVGIKYIHIPELGIISSKRKNLNSLKDYQILFEEYEETVLKDNNKSLKKIQELFESNERIALTCFEKEVCMCHRGKVAEALLKLPNWDIPLKHIT